MLTLYRGLGAVSIQQVDIIKPNVNTFVASHTFYGKLQQAVHGFIRIFIFANDFSLSELSEQ